VTRYASGSSSSFLRHRRKFVQVFRLKFVRVFRHMGGVHAIGAPHSPTRFENARLGPAPERGEISMIDDKWSALLYKSTLKYTAIGGNGPWLCSTHTHTHTTHTTHTHARARVHANTPTPESFHAPCTKLSYRRLGRRLQSVEVEPLRCAPRTGPSGRKHGRFPSCL
jgi:hypothetical protein